MAAGTINQKEVTGETKQNPKAAGMKSQKEVMAEMKPSLLLATEMINLEGVIVLKREGQPEVTSKKKMTTLM